MHHRVDSDQDNDIYRQTEGNTDRDKNTPEKEQHNYTNIYTEYLVKSQHTATAKDTTNIRTPIWRRIKCALSRPSNRTVSDLIRGKSKGAIPLLGHRRGARFPFYGR